jgi:hypothetical protein
VELLCVPVSLCVGLVALCIRKVKNVSKVHIASIFTAVRWITSKKQAGKI